MFLIILGWSVLVFIACMFTFFLVAGLYVSTVVSGNFEWTPTIIYGGASVCMWYWVWTLCPFALKVVVP